MIRKSRLGVLGHAKLVAKSLKDMRVVELSLTNNGFTDGDIFMLKSQCRGTQLRKLNVHDQKNVRDAAICKAMQTLKPDGLELCC
jgi:hypothetical protein